MFGEVGPHRDGEIDVGVGDIRFREPLEVGRRERAEHAPLVASDLYLDVTWRLGFADSGGSIVGGKGGGGEDWAEAEAAVGERQRQRLEAQVGKGKVEWRHHWWLLIGAGKRRPVWLKDGTIQITNKSSSSSFGPYLGCGLWAVVGLRLHLMLDQNRSIRIKICASNFEIHTY